MSSFFETIYKASVTSNQLADLAGRVIGLALGIVSTNSDPDSLARIKVWEPSKGAKAETDWLYRVQPMSYISTPVPMVGQTVALGFIDGNPHQGVYLGTLQNFTNNVLGNPDQLVLMVGDTKLVISAGSIAITGVTSISINGKEVATLGARDSRNDSLITKGW